MFVTNRASTLTNRAITLLLGGCMLILSACDSSEDAGQCDVPFDIEEVVEGDGAEAVLGKSVSVHYEGFFCETEAADLKGAKFDSSVDRGVPFQFVVGAREVIQGWDEGIPGMKVGGRRTLTIPPEKAYGESGQGDTIPPNATLIFEVELVDVR